MLLSDVEYAVAHNAARSLLRLGRPGRAALAASEHRAETEPHDQRVLLGAAHAREALAAAELEDHRRQLVP